MKTTSRYGDWLRKVSLATDTGGMRALRTSSLAVLILVAVNSVLADTTDNKAELHRQPKTDNPQEILVWSHNDYEQQRPLQQALEYGYQMIEVDIHLIDGKLRVAHDHPDHPDEVPELINLYIKPLIDIIEKNNGVVLPGSNVPFYLVIDVKTGAESTFNALSNVLKPYAEYFERFESGSRIEGPVRLLISGNRPDLSDNLSDRMVFIDGRLSDLGKNLEPDLYPLISDNWNRKFTWDGTGEMPEEEFNKLVAIVNQTHKEGKKIRFWATRDRENVWETLLDAGVDVINLDNLEKMRQFLDEYSGPRNQ